MKQSKAYPSLPSQQTHRSAWMDQPDLSIRSSSQQPKQRMVSTPLKRRMPTWFRPVWFFWKDTFTVLAVLSLMALGLSLLSPLVESPPWWLDVWTHFRWTYCFVIPLMLLGLVAQRRWVFFAVGAVALTFNVFAVIPLFVEETPSPLPAAVVSAEIKILHANVWVFNNDIHSLESLVQAERPDVISLNEVDRHWPALIRQSTLFRDYPYRVMYTADIALLSRYPIVSHKRHTLLYPRSEFVLDSWLEATINSGNRPFNVLLAHPRTPVSFGGYDRQQKLLTKVAERASALKQATLLMGDLNTTPWSSTFTQLTQRTGFRHGREGQGVEATWPLAVGRLIGLPLDHVLASPDLRITSFDAVGDIHSDHAPVVATVQL